MVSTEIAINDQIVMVPLMARQILGIPANVTQGAPSLTEVVARSEDVGFSYGESDLVVSRWNLWWRDCLLHLEIVPSRFLNQRAEREAFSMSVQTRVGRAPAFKALSDCPPLRDAAERAHGLWMQRFSRFDDNERDVVELISQSVNRVHVGDPMDLDISIYLSVIPVEGLWQHLSPPGVGCISVETLQDESARDKVIAALIAK